MEISYYFNNFEEGKAVLILGSKCHRTTKIKGNTIRDFLMKVSTERRIDKVVKMVGLDYDILDKKVDDISNLQESLVLIAYQLLQSKELVINYLDVLLNHKEEIYLKRLLNKLVHQYNLKVIIFTNNMSFCFGLVDEIFIVKNKEIIKCLPNNFYNLELYQYIDMPEIIRFVLHAQAKGKKLANYLEMSELIKGIYRL